MLYTKISLIGFAIGGLLAALPARSAAPNAQRPTPNASPSGSQPSAYRLAPSAQSPSLATTPASAVALNGFRLYVGSPDGSLRMYSVTGTLESTFDPIAGGPVSLVAASPTGTAWIVGGRPAGIKDPAGGETPASDQTLIVWAGTTIPLKIDLKPAGVTGPVRALGWLGTRLAIMQEFGTVFFDAKEGAIVTPESFLKPEIAALTQTDRMWIADGQEDSKLVLFAHPHAVRRSPLTQGSPVVSLLTAYRTKGDSWWNLGGVATSAMDVVPSSALLADDEGKIKPGATFKVVSETVGLGTYGISAIEAESLLTVPVTKAGWESARQPLAAWAADRTAAADPLWYGQTANSAWWWTGTILMQQEFEKGVAHAYLPVQLGDAHVNGIAADQAGLWLATDAGVRRVNPLIPDAAGFGGFVRLPLGPETLKTQTPDQWKLAQEIYQWRFAPAEKAGADSTTMVSKVFAALGINVPASRTAILTTGADVLGDLQFGDVLVFAKSVAIYVGDGHTVEVRDGTVRNGDVWARRVVGAKRMLK